MKRLIYSILTIAVFVGFFSSCSEDALDPTLMQDKNLEENINTAGELNAVLLSAYNRLTTTPYYGRDVIIYGEVMSDNTYANGASGRFLEPARMDMGADVAYPEDTWDDIYSMIASANTIIKQNPDELEGDANAIRHDIGEAYALRALGHFDLLKFYGQQHVDGSDLGVPYKEEIIFDITDLSTEERYPSRNTVEEVKQLIESDIATALDMMSEDNNDNYQYLTTYGVQALKSRVALYFGDWQDVVDASEAIINSGDYSIVPAANYVQYWQSDGGVNSIFELAFNGTDNRGINGLENMYRYDAYGDVAVLMDLASIFDSTDVRMMGQLTQPNLDGEPVTVNMIGWGAQTGFLRNNGKYPDPNYNDNVPIFRYEEIILNYAEALYELGQDGINGNSALDYLNMIPENRNATTYSTIDKDNILQERRKELCFEGFRFHDLARTGRDIPLVDPDNQTHGGPDYGTYHYAFPIPEEEVNANVNMVQNQGY